MNTIEKIFCRTYQGVFRLAMLFLPYRTPKILESIEEIAPLLKKLDAQTVLLVTDGFVRKSGITKDLEESLAGNGINAVVYDETNANPTVENVYKAKELYQKNEHELKDIYFRIAEW